MPERDYNKMDGGDKSTIACAAIVCATILLILFSILGYFFQRRQSFIDAGFVYKQVGESVYPQYDWTKE